MRSENIRRVVILAAFGVVSTSAVIASAATYSFGPAGSVAYTGNWNISTDWNPAGVPSVVSGDTANVTGGGTVLISDAQSIARFNLGSSTSGIGQFTVTGTGSLLVSGTVTNSGALQVGSAASSSASGSVEVGGTITFDTNCTAGALSMGNAAGSNGTLNVSGNINYNLTGGSGQGARIGYFGSGTLNINNGANVDLRSLNTGTQLEMGFNQGANGTLNVNGGTLLVNFINVRNTSNASNPVNVTATVNISGGTSTFATTSTNGIFQTNPGLTTVSFSGGQLNVRSPLHSSTTQLAQFAWTGGTIQMYQASGTITFATNMNLAGGGSGAVFDSNGTTNIFSGTLSGTGSLTKTGAGQLTLSGSQQYSGGLTVNQGTLAITNASNSLTGGVTLNGGVLQVGTTGTPLGPVSSVLTLAGGTLQSTGSGSISIGNTVSLTGNVNIGAATTQTGRVQFTAPINLGGGTRTVTASGIGTAGRVLDFNGGSISNGTLVLVAGTGAERYRFAAVPVNGGITIQSGTLYLGSSFALGAGATVTLNSPGAIELNEANSFRNLSVGTLNGNGAVTNTATTAGTSILTFGGSGTGSFSGTISDGAPGALLAVSTLGGVHQTLTNPANSFTGPVTLNSGTLQVSSIGNGGVASALGAGSGGVYSLLLNGGTLAYSGPAADTDRLFNLSSSGGAIDASGTGELRLVSTGSAMLDETYQRTYATLTAGATTIPGVDVSGVNAGQVISGPGIAPGTTVVSTSGGTVTLSQAIVSTETNAVVRFTSASTNDRTFTLTGASTADNLLSVKLTDPSVGRTALTKAGAGTWVLGAANTYTGPTTVNAGTLKLGAGASLASALIEVASGATLDPTAAYPLSFPIASGVTLRLNGTVVGPVTNDGAVQFRDTSDSTIANVFTGTGSFEKPVGAGTLTFTGAANFPTSFTLSAGKTIFAPGSSLGSDAIRVFSNAQLDVSAIPGGVVVGAGKTMIMNGVVTGAIANSGVVSITTSADRTYPANISGSGTLTKADGAGTATLTGNVSVTGVSVSSGSLIVKSPLGPVTGSLVVTGPGVSTTLDASDYVSVSTYAVTGTFGSVTVGSNGQTGVSNLRLAAVPRPANKPAVLVTSGLTIEADDASSYSGFVDLGNGDLIVKGGAGSVGTLGGYVAAWLGSGVTPVGLGSSSASPNAAPYTTVAVFSNDAGGVAHFSTYDGVSLNSADAIVKYTYLGDTDLNGILDGNDVANVLEGYSTGQGGWGYGDQNYDGTVSQAEVSAFLTAYAWFIDPINNAPSLGNGVGNAGGSGAVPEPAALGLLVPAVLGLSRRRRV